jgi:hypothetical protein
MYQNPFLNPYGAYPQQYQQIAQTQPLQQVVRVNGENGAKTYQLGANGSALLLDESGSMVWLVVSDGAGYKTVSAYDITPHQTVPAPDYGNLEDRIKRLEMIVNGNSKHTDAISTKQSDVRSDKANDGNGKNFSKPTGNA